MIVDNCLSPVTLVKTPGAWATYMGVLSRSFLNKLHELLHSNGVRRCEFSAISYPISTHLDILISSTNQGDGVAGLELVQHLLEENQSYHLPNYSHINK